MTMFQPIALASDRVMAALRSGLELEFGRGAGAALAARFLEAEETDIRWDARVAERWIGAYLAQEDDLELDRIVAPGFLDGRWFVGIFIVDGDGNAHGMLCCRIFACDEAASQAFAQMR